MVTPPSRAGDRPPGGDGRRFPAAVLGAGTRGMDLLDRLEISLVLSCALITGQPGDVGLTKAAERRYRTSTEGITAVVRARRRGVPIEVVFDTSEDPGVHAANREAVAGTGVLMVALSPGAGHGVVVPRLNDDTVATNPVANLGSWGAQAVIPVLRAVVSALGGYPLDRIRVVAGPTPAQGLTGRLRAGYLAATRTAVRELGGLDTCEVVSPPPTTRLDMDGAAGALVSVTAPRSWLEPVRVAVADAAEQVRSYAPGYEAEVHVAGPVLRVTIRIASTASWLRGRGGDVELLGAAAVELATRRFSTGPGHRATPLTGPPTGSQIGPVTST